MAVLLQGLLVGSGVVAGPAASPGTGSSAVVFDSMQVLAKNGVHFADYIGRFDVPELARPRTHMERERTPTSVRPRDRGIAAVGFTLSF